MKKNKSKHLLFAALTALFLFMPARDAHIPETTEAAQVSDSHDSKLSAFDIAPGVLSPAFSPDILEYTSTVDENVTSVSVQAVPRASGAVIASIEGREGLHPGINTIKATCSAQDNTFTVYTITLTVGSANAGTQQTDQNQPVADSADDSQSAENQEGTQPDTALTGDTQPDTGTAGDTQPDTGAAGGDAQPDAGASQAQTTKKRKKRSVAARLMGAVNADGTVKLSGAQYRLSSNFTYGTTTQDIPSAFGQGSVQIGGSNYATLYCEANGVHLVYMENTDGNGSTGFYYYDEIQNAVERFKYIGSGDNFVVLISSAREEAPTGYEQISLKLSSGKKVAAYQNPNLTELQDYYLVYGIYADGSSSWYLYDKKQETYLRYSNAFAAIAQDQEEDDAEEEVERTVSLTKYNTLNEKYTELKESRVKIVSILAIAIVLIIIVFTALLLRGRDEEESDPDTDGGERSSKKKKPKKTRKQPETISKSSLAAGRNFGGNVGKKSKKVTKTFTQEPAENVQRTPAARQDNTQYVPAARQGNMQRIPAARQDDISTPEEIRAQVSRDQAMYSQQSRIKKGNEQKLREPQSYEQRLNEQRLLKNQSAAGSPDSVQLAAERMRQSVRYTRSVPKPEAMEQEHDPMDDWDMEDTVSRKSQKAGKSSKKKRSRREEDMEIMDLNDL